MIMAFPRPATKKKRARPLISSPTAAATTAGTRAAAIQKNTNRNTNVTRSGAPKEEDEQTNTKKLKSSTTTTTTTAAAAAFGRLPKQKSSAPPSHSRQKQKLYQQQQGINLPDIPGVPIQIVPLMVNTLQMTTKFFQHCRQKSITLPSLDNSKVEETLIAQKTTLSETSKSQRQQPNTVLDHVLNRFENVMGPDSEQRKEQQTQQMERKKIMEESIQSWLEAMKKYISADTKSTIAYNYYAKQRLKNNPPLPDDNDDIKLAIEEKEEIIRNRQITKTQRVPLASFLYLWKLGQDHNRIKVRRAALYLCGHLLSKSSDCRRWLLKDNDGGHVWEWVQFVAFWNNISNNNNEEEVKLWKRESKLLLSYLIDEGYQNRYPKLFVAEQYLKQQIGSYLWDSEDEEHDPEQGRKNDGLESNATATGSQRPNTNDNNTTSMADWRRLRDIALQHGQKEILAVQKLLDCAHKCMDILVPRFGFDNDPHYHDDNKDKNKRKKQANNKNDDNVIAKRARSQEETKKDGNDNHYDDDDDDNDVNWEDGWDDNNEEEDTNVDNIKVKNDNKVEYSEDEEDGLSHIAKVERTIEIIQTVGNLRRQQCYGTSNGDGLEIDLNQTTDRQPTATIEESSEHYRLTRAKFRRIQRIVSTRHMPRLQEWIEGLSKADSLIIRYSESGEYSSLILMPSMEAQRRDKILKQLIKLKKSASTILSSAAKLGLK